MPGTILGYGDRKVNKKTKSLQGTHTVGETLLEEL